MAPPVVQVDPQGFAKAAEVYEGVHNTLTYGVDTLTKVLAGASGCAGSDNADRNRTNDYDPGAWNMVYALSDLALAVGQMHDLLEFTAANHSNAAGPGTTCRRLARAESSRRCHTGPPRSPGPGVIATVSYRDTRAAIC